MYYLFHNSIDRQVEIADIKPVGRGLELLETNQSVEALVVRSEMYKKTYRCELVNHCVDDVNKRTINTIRNKNIKRRLSDETKQKISKGVTGERNGRYGAVDPEHIRLSKSEKLKFYYKYNVHGKKNYKDSDETRRKKSENNCNKGGWFWICNRSTGEEKRCFGEIPEGFRKGRLRNYLLR